MEDHVLGFGEVALKRRASLHNERVTNSNSVIYALLFISPSAYYGKGAWLFRAGWLLI